MAKFKILEIDNSKKAAIRTGKWKAPGAAFYDQLMNAIHCKGEIPADKDQLDEKIKNGDYKQWPELLKEAYLVAPVKDIKGPPYGVTPYSRSGCKYPHHVIKGDKLVVSIPGLRAAYICARNQGCFDSDPKKRPDYSRTLSAHLNRHCKELGLKPVWHHGEFYLMDEAAEVRIEENFEDINLFLMERTGINLFDPDDGYLAEASHGKLKFEFRRAYDVNTGHALKLVYSLEGITVTRVGDGTSGNEEERLARIADVQKNITRKGNMDHADTGGKVLAIIDRVTNQRIQSALTCGPYTPGIPSSALQLDEDNLKYLHSKDEAFKKRYFNEVRVGEIDTSSTYKSTFWPKQDKQIRKLRNGRQIESDRVGAINSPAEMLDYGRGMKLNDIKPSNTTFITKGNVPTYLHPSKKDIRRNPNLYEAVIEGPSDNPVLSSDFNQEVGDTTPQALWQWMHDNIQYDKDGANWKLRTAAKLYMDKKGNCHDQSYFAAFILHSWHYRNWQLYFVEFSDNSEQGGNSHTLTYYLDGGKYYWFENAWEDQAGIHGPYDSKEDIKQAVLDAYAHDYDLNSHKFDGIVFAENPNYRLGMNLWDYCSSWNLTDDRRFSKDTPTITASITKTKNPNDPESQEAVNIDFYNDKHEQIGEASVSAVDTDHAFLYNVEVFEGYRGSGYGKAIIEYCLSHYKITELTVEPTNTIAIKLYEQYGFKKYMDWEENGKKLIDMRRDTAQAIKEAADWIDKFVHDESFRETAEFFEEGWLAEASHGTLKVDHREVIDYDTGHMLHIVYSLDNIEITGLGVAHNFDPNKFQEVQKNIRRRGNTDHQSKGQKVLAIVDRYTGARKTSARVIGIYDPIVDIQNIKDERSGVKGFELLAIPADELKKIHDKVDAAGAHVNEIKVGEIDNHPSFKSTTWHSDILGLLMNGKPVVAPDAKSKKEFIQVARDKGTEGGVTLGLYNRNNEVRTAAEKFPYGRGAKMNDLETPYQKGWDETPFKHPSKRDLKKAARGEFIESDEIFSESTAISTMSDLIKNFKTPGELLKWMSCIQYAFLDKDGKEIEDKDDDIYNKYRFQSPLQLIRTKKGVCWDCTALEREWFERSKYPFCEIYLEIHDNENCPSHTVVIFKEPGETDQVAWFESSWDAKRGIHWFGDLKTCMNNIVDEFLKSHDADPKKAKLICKSIKKGKKYGCTMQEYMDFAYASMDIDLGDLFYDEVFNEGAIPHQDYTFDDLPNELYFSSPFKIKELKGRVFMSPYAGISSIFLVNRSKVLRECAEKELGHAPTRNSVNIGYKEWNYEVEDLQRPLKTVHMNHNIPELKEKHHGTASGYIYKVDISDVRDKLSKHGDQPLDHEVIYTGDEPLKILEVKPHTVKWEFEFSEDNMKHNGKGFIESGDIFDPEGPHWSSRLFMEAEEEEAPIESQPIDDDPPPTLDDTIEQPQEPAEDDGPKEGDELNAPIPEPVSEPAAEEQPEEAPAPQPEAPKKESMPKRADREESDKNGVRRKKLYIAFIEWCKEYNNKNAFGSIFDKDAFKVSYPFVPDEMRYFYRLANPMLCILSGNLTFFPVAELRKINSQNKKLDEVMIFAGTENDFRVFNVKDKGVYIATEENGEVKLGAKLAETFDLYIQNMIDKGDILNGPIEESVEEWYY